MFETSKDILNLVIAVGVAGFAFFLCWAMYYLVVSLHRIFKLTKKIDQVIKKVEDVAELVKDKMSNASSYLLVLGEVVKKVMSMSKGGFGFGTEDEDDEEEEPVKKTRKKTTSKRKK